jgi:hypothetical protein
MRMIRLLILLLLGVLTGCATPATAPTTTAKPESGYAGTVQKVFRVVRQGADLPGMRLFGKLGNALGAALRQTTETQQYVVRTPTGQITAQSDEQFAVGDCVEVLPQTEASAGPAFRYGEAQIIRSETCPERLSRL